MDMEDLPKSLQKAIEDMEGAWAKVDEGTWTPLSIYLNRMK